MPHDTELRFKFEHVQVHFAVRHDRDALSQERKRVIIRAERRNSDDIFELIPRDKLKPHLPAPLIEGHVHWLNLSTPNIEIRPLKEPWEQSSDNWSIDLRRGWSHITKGDKSLVDKRSATWTMVSGRLLCLDEPENLVITLSPVDATQRSSLQLSVVLPRYGLSFFVNELGNLESHDFKGMVYDEDQSIGTLFGLVNRLVLCPKSQVEEDLIPRLVLIPYGPSLRQDGYAVHVELASSGPVRYYTYQVDRELGCLTGFVNLESRLHLAHLHALCSRVFIPDLLTGRTGMEEAFSLVWLAGTRQGASVPEFKSQYYQIRYAFAKIQDGTHHEVGLPPEVALAKILDGIHHEVDLPTEVAFLREARLFPSGIDARVQLSKQPEEHLGLNELLRERSPPDLRARNGDGLPLYDPCRHGLSTPHVNSLPQLFSSLRADQSISSKFQDQYIARLHSSADHLWTAEPTSGANFQDSWKPDIEKLRMHYGRSRTSYLESLDMIKKVLCPQTQLEQVLDQRGQWPRVTPFVLFRCLASTSPIKPPEEWKTCLISLALLASDLQRARRLLRFASDNLEEELYSELENEGCDGWDPGKHPDWLLIQVRLLSCECSSLLIFCSGFLSCRETSSFVVFRPTSQRK